MHEEYRKAYLVLGIVAVLSWIGLALFIYFVSPTQLGVWSVFIFYTLLWCAVFCTVAILELVVRRKFITAPFPHTRKASLRQAFLSGLLVTLLLILQAQGLLFWWVGASILLLFVCVEAFMHT